MRLLAPAGEVYQAGTLSGNPLARRRGPRDALAARRARLPAPRLAHRAARRRPARGGGRRRGRPGSGRQRPGSLDRLLLRAPRPLLRRRARLRPGRLRRLVSRAALARGLSAALPVRGVVPLARAHSRAHRAHARRRRRRLRGASDELAEPRERHTRWSGSSVAARRGRPDGEPRQQRSAAHMTARAIAMARRARCSTRACHRPEPRRDRRCPAPGPRSSPPRVRAPRAAGRTTSC